MTTAVRLPPRASFLRPVALSLCAACLTLPNSFSPAQTLPGATQSFASLDAGQIYLNYDGRYAFAPQGMPLAVHRIVDAANQLQRTPYVWGGGHKHYWDRGYDCSGSISHCLANAGLLSKPLTAAEFKRFGDPGPGRFVTLFMNDGHVFMSVCGLRFDTSEIHDDRGKGPRWRPESRSPKGFYIRHPRGL